MCPLEAGMPSASSGRAAEISSGSLALPFVPNRTKRAVISFLRFSAVLARRERTLRRVWMGTGVSREID